jgi:protocatechuate 3,4-dioxygenase beta subunit
MQTTGPLPTTARISTSAATASVGQQLTIAARRVAGYLGAPVPGTRAELWAAGGTAASSLRAVGTADGAGLVQFPVQQSDTTSYQVRFPGSGTWGASTSSSTTVQQVRLASSVRLSVDRRSVPPGHPVVVGMRVVSATNAGLAGVPVQLWQTVDGRTWGIRATVTTDAAGLAHVTRYPTDPVTYQGRFPGTTGWTPSVSASVQVAMVR